MRRIGLILANLKRDMGGSFARNLEREISLSGEASLILFPGGQLGSVESSLYALAGPEALDGLVLWAGSLARSATETERFARNKASGLPVVSVGLEVKDVPSVTFDAYAGMKAEVLHLIRTHGHKKIAFLRGPEGHRNAETRYAGYLDALKEAGLALDERLVSSPCQWHEGEEAFEELVQGRGLVPGKDFSCLVASSDLLLDKVVPLLRSSGLRLPEDLAVAGFNVTGTDSGLTSVRVPLEKLANAALAFLSEGGRRGGNLNFPVKLVTRRSCGCDSAFPSGSYSLKAFCDELSSRLGSGRAVSSALKALEALRNGSGRTEDLKWCAEVFAEEGSDFEVLLDAMSVYSKLFSAEIDHDSFERFHKLLLYSMQRRVSEDRRQMLDNLSMLSRFQSELSEASTLGQTVACMASFLPGLGVREGFLFLYDGLTETLCAGGFSERGLFAGGERFKRGLFLPPSLSRLPAGVYIAEPLCHGSENMGYLLLAAEAAEGQVLESVGASLSAVLQKLRLAEEADRAMSEAERKGMEAQALYKGLAEGVLAPIREMKDGNGGESCMGRLLASGELLEEALSGSHGPSLEKRWCPLWSLLSRLEEAGLDVEAPMELPCFMMDAEKLASAIVYCFPVSTVSARLARGGSELSFPRTPSAGFAYLQRLMLAHGGSCRIEEGRTVLTMPYISFSGSLSGGMGEGYVFFAGDGAVPDCLSRFPLRTSADTAFKEVVDTLPAAVAWRRESEGSVLVNLLGSHKAIQGLPSLCFGGGGTPRASGESVVLCSFCKVPEELSFLSDYGSILPVSAIGELERSQARPLLFLAGDVDASLFSELRAQEKFSRVPLLVVRDRLTLAEAQALSSFPALLAVNPCLLEAEAFQSRLLSVIGGASLLPMQSGALVKKAIAYINENATGSVTRWKLADAVNLSEDYIARIFRRETGISPWEYLARYRVQLAVGMLRGTGLSISEIASEIGFQDQSYFSRVFRKIKGFPPGKLRHGA